MPEISIMDDQSGATASKDNIAFNFPVRAEDIKDSDLLEILNNVSADLERKGYKVEIGTAPLDPAYYSPTFREMVKAFVTRSELQPHLLPCIHVSRNVTDQERQQFQGKSEEAANSRLFATLKAEDEAIDLLEGELRKRDIKFYPGSNGFKRASVVSVMGSSHSMEQNPLADLHFGYSLYYSSKVRHLVRSAWDAVQPQLAAKGYMIRPETEWERKSNYLTCHLHRSLSEDEKSRIKNFQETRHSIEAKAADDLFDLMKEELQKRGLEFDPHKNGYKAAMTKPTIKIADHNFGFNSDAIQVTYKLEPSSFYALPLLHAAWEKAEQILTAQGYQCKKPSSNFDSMHFAFSRPTTEEEKDFIGSITKDARIPPRKQLILDRIMSTVESDFQQAIEKGLPDYMRFEQELNVRGLAA